MDKPTLRIRNKGLVKVKVSDLEEAPWNHRDHPLLQQEALAGAIADPLIGYAGYPDVYDAGDGVLRLIDGHLRKGILLRHYGPETEIEVNLTDFDEAGAKAYNLTKDPLAALAESNRPKLDALLAENRITSEPLLKMLEGLAKEAGCDWHSAAAVDEDEVPEPPKNPRTKPGDVWILGKHRLMCGDSTSAEDVGNLMIGQKATMCFTDPPWNVAIGLDSNPRHRQRAGLTNDKLSAEDFQSFLERFIQQVVAFVKGDLYCVLGASEWPRLDSTLRRAGFHWSATIIWVKDIFVLGSSKYHRRYEPLWYGWHEKAKSSFGESRDLDDVWEIPRPRRSEEHPTMKPVALVARAITNSSQPGDLVFEPFSGSGTTLIAAEQLGRRCYAMEIDPGYVDVCIQRWEATTLRKAVLEKPSTPS